MSQSRPLVDLSNEDTGSIQKPSFARRAWNAAKNAVTLAAAFVAVSFIALGNYLKTVPAKIAAVPSKVKAAYNSFSFQNFYNNNARLLKGLGLLAVSAGIAAAVVFTGGFAAVPTVGAFLIANTTQWGAFAILTAAIAAVGAVVKAGFDAVSTYAKRPKTINNATGYQPMQGGNTADMGQGLGQGLVPSQGISSTSSSSPTSGELQQPEQPEQALNNQVDASSSLPAPGK